MLINGTANKKFQLNCNELRKKLTEIGYEEQESIERVQTFDKNGLTREKEKKKYNSDTNYTYLQPLSTSKLYQQTLSTTPIFAFRRKETLHDLLRCKNIANNRVPKNSNKKIGFFTKCFSKLGNLSCKQALHSSSFTSYITKKAYNIFYNLDCRSKLVIYLVECTICHIQYVNKSETQVNLRLNNGQVENSENLEISENSEVFVRDF